MKGDGAEGSRSARQPKRNSSHRNWRRHLSPRNNGAAGQVSRETKYWAGTDNAHRRANEEVRMRPKMNAGRNEGNPVPKEKSKCATRMVKKREKYMYTSQVTL